MLNNFKLLYIFLMVRKTMHFLRLKANYKALYWCKPESQWQFSIIANSDNKIKYWIQDFIIITKKLKIMKSNVNINKDTLCASYKNDQQPNGLSGLTLLGSTASNNLTTSSISGRFSGFASQHFLIILATSLGQLLGIFGRKFCCISNKIWISHVRKQESDIRNYHGMQLTNLTKFCFSLCYR